MQGCELIMMAQKYRDGVDLYQNVTLLWSVPVLEIVQVVNLILHSGGPRVLKLEEVSLSILGLLPASARIM